MPTVKEVIESNYLALLTPLITLGLEVLASLMMLTPHCHLEPHRQLLQDATGQTDLQENYPIRKLQR